MIPAERAEKIMQLYEEDYDNFLDKLRAKRKAKKEAADKKATEAQKADQNLKEADAHKKTHLKDKAKALVEKNGGITGIMGTANNVVKYFSDNSPSDYDVNIGKDDETVTDDKIMGMSPAGFYTAAGLLVIVAIFAASKMIKSKPESTAIPQAA